MSVTNRFPEWGKTGEEPPLGFEYDGGDQVNEKHLNYLWSAINLQTDDFIERTDEIEEELQSEVTRLEGDINDNTTDIESLETSFDDHSDRHAHDGADEIEITELSGRTGEEDQVAVVQADGTLAYDDAGGVEPEELFWYSVVY